MLVWSNGKILGSIGGGCSEGEVINNARYILRNGGYQIQSIDMTGYIFDFPNFIVSFVQHCYKRKCCNKCN